MQLYLCVLAFLLYGTALGAFDIEKAKNVEKLVKEQAYSYETNQDNTEIEYAAEDVITLLTLYCHTSCADIDEKLDCDSLCNVIAPAYKQEEGDITLLLILRGSLFEYNPMKKAVSDVVSLMVEEDLDDVEDVAEILLDRLIHWIDDTMINMAEGEHEALERMTTSEVEATKEGFAEEEKTPKYKSYALPVKK